MYAYILKNIYKQPLMHEFTFYDIIYTWSIVIQNYKQKISETINMMYKMHMIICM